MTPLRPPVRPLNDPGNEYVWRWLRGYFLFRVYHEHPGRPPGQARTFGPYGRFDPHVRDRRRRPREQADGRGVNYLAADLGTALAEAFPDQRPEVEICPRTRAIRACPEQTVKLLDLAGDGIMKIGAVATLGSGCEPRRATQRWGRAIYEDLPTLAGVRYRGAHQSGISVAVWERAGSLLLEPTDASMTRFVGAFHDGLPLLGTELRSRTSVALGAQGRYPVPISRQDCKRCQAAEAAA